MKTTPRHKVRRVKDRARYDRADIYAILDASWIAHVTFSVEGQPFVIPMLYVRDEDSLVLHGGIASRLQQELAKGIETCICVTLVDGLVLARSHFHHSVNYRSVVAFGKSVAITDQTEKTAALSQFVDAILPGRTSESRPPDEQELAATSVLRFNIVDASAKVRAGDPKDTASDLDLPYWAGVIPMTTTYGKPIPSSDMMDSSIPLPGSVKKLY